MVTAVVGLMLAVVPYGLSPATQPRAVGGPVLVTVAEVTHDRARLWVRSDTATPIRVRYATEDGTGSGRVHELVPDVARDLTTHAVLGDLAPGTRYRYELEQGEETVSGTFATARADGDGTPVTLLWSGDLGGRGHCRAGDETYTIFDAMRQRHADFFLFVGDTIYADHRCGAAPPGGPSVATTVPDFYAKHRANRADRAVQRFLRDTPVYAIWDDHEVRNNFAGPREPLMPAGRRAFQDYWAITGPPDEPGRLYRGVRWGRHVEVFILDTRQYRTANHEPDGPGKSMLSAAQRDWLLAGLARSTATWKLIVSSVPLGVFTGGASSDSWSSANALGYPRRGVGFVHERDLILETIRARGITNVVFVSGDVHHAEIIRYEPAPGVRVHELLAGPLAARPGFPRFLDRTLGGRSLGALGWTTNFGEIRADAAALTVRIVDAAGEIRLQRTIPTAAGDTTLASGHAPDSKARPPTATR